MICMDEYGRELDGVTRWAELPYPRNQMALPLVGENRRDSNGQLDKEGEQAEER